MGVSHHLVRECGCLPVKTPCCQGLTFVLARSVRFSIGYALPQDCLQVQGTLAGPEAFQTDACLLCHPMRPPGLFLLLE